MNFFVCTNLLNICIQLAAQGKPSFLGHQAYAEWSPATGGDPYQCWNRYGHVTFVCWQRHIDSAN